MRVWRAFVPRSVRRGPGPSCCSCRSTSSLSSFQGCSTETPGCGFIPGRFKERRRQYLHTYCLKTRTIHCCSTLFLKVRKPFPRYSSAQLTSTKILARRSAVPAVVSRILASKKRKPILSREDKERLLCIAKRPRKGPLNSVMDPSEYAPGSSVFGISEAVRKSGTYDPWVLEPPKEVLKDGLETVQAVVVKVIPICVPWGVMISWFLPGRSCERLD